MRQQPERGLHKLCVQWLELARPDILYWHPANGEVRSKRTAALLKAMGVKAGAPDLMFVLPDGRFAGIELKAAKRKPTEEQLAFGHAVTQRNGLWAWCDNFENFRGTVDAWFGRRGHEQDRNAREQAASLAVEDTADAA